jgi:hypothetical protein
MVSQDLNMHLVHGNNICKYSVEIKPLISVALLLVVIANQNYIPLA